MPSLNRTQWPSNIFDDGAPVEVQAPKKSFFDRYNPLLSFIATLFALGANWLGLNKRYPWLEVALPWVVGILLLMIATPFAVRAWKWVRDRFADRAFVAVESKRLAEQFDLFQKFICSNDGSSFFYISRTGDFHRLGPEAVTIALDSYLDQWNENFRRQLGFPARSPSECLHRCREFSWLVHSFNQCHVQRLQGFLSTRSEVHASALEQLEVFREAFNDYLRGLERWSRSVSAAAQGRATEGSAAGPDLPIGAFAPVKPFRAAQPAKVT